MDIDFVVVGTAPGAEQLIQTVCRKLLFNLVIVPPNLPRYENNATGFRNDFIARYFKPTHLLAFHERIEESRSTAQCLRIAKKNGIDFQLVKK